MLKLIQAEVYRISRSRLFFLSLCLSAFFMFSFVTTFHYTKVKLPLSALNRVTISIDEFTGFLFSDYSLIIPITLFLVVYFVDDYTNGLRILAFSKGITRGELFFGKWMAAWLLVMFYFLFNMLLAYLLFIPLTINQYPISFSFAQVFGFLLLQMLCFIGYTCLLGLVCCIIRVRSIILAVLLVLAVVLYVYLTKISAALGVSYSLYQYWIIGLSHKMDIAAYKEHLPVIVATLAGYLLIPTLLAYYLANKAETRRSRRGSQ
jgi:ABC-type transport system involved in multi-copper enzyme maturation permease subunit